MKHFIAIAGNMGAGKTTLAEKLTKHLNWELFEEPFEANPYLENFYADMKTWAFHTEMSFLGQRLNHHIEILKKPHSIIQDRCLYEGAEIFVKNLYQTNCLSSTDWKTYNHLYQNLIKTIKAPDAIIYLNQTPEQCILNVQKRGRDLEKNIDPAYVFQLAKLYDEWKNNFSLCPIIDINMQKNNLINDESAFSRFVDSLQQKLAR
ncbi:MAG: Deoxyguanosine kinase / deoxyadenosine kinase subunit [Parcubacteria group bacterium GW2011_GWA2_40_23]|nr:MAG: Deoxyguanosine kinase / deoxyadenosine kinase subunit [Parcubacteria group bacterium GW2011_GWA2_40_23]